MYARTPLNIALPHTNFHNNTLIVRTKHASPSPPLTTPIVLRVATATRRQSSGERSNSAAVHHQSKEINTNVAPFLPQHLADPGAVVAQRPWTGARRCRRPSPHVDAGAMRRMHICR